MLLLYYLHLLVCILPLSFSMKSYLDWPRIHFGGDFVAEVPTLNNIRCNFKMDKFTSASLSKENVLLRQNDVTGTYSVGWHNFSPDGSGHFMFCGAAVTSFCKSAEEGCSDTDPIVGLKVAEMTRAALAVLDTDWETTTTIFGLVINIAGILQGDFELSQEQKEVAPFGFCEVQFKSRLKNIKWMNAMYADMFGNADELAISLSLDRYSQDTYIGRVTATIGPTSEDDPLTMASYRAMQPAQNLRPAPFVYHKEEKLLLIDLSLGLMPDADGNYFADNYGQLDLGLLTSPTDCLAANQRTTSCASDAGQVPVTWITTGGAVSQLIGNDNKWLETYGGVLTFNLSTIDPATEAMLSNTTMALLQSSENSSIPAGDALLEEFPYGIRIGLMNQTIERANVGDTFTWTVFVTSWGEPVVGALVSLNIMKNAIADTDCGFGCDLSLGTPMSSLVITPVGGGSGGDPDNGLSGNIALDEKGMATFTLKAASNPGAPRGCGIDGQIYPLEIRLLYDTPDDGGTVTFVEGDITAIVPPANDYDYALRITSPAVLIYTEIEQPADPTWDDVGDIFRLYFNLIPVMWKNRIVNLGSYEGVVDKRDGIVYSMSLDFNDPKYMPVTRDLSASKLQMINTWFANGMKRHAEGIIINGTDGSGQRKISDIILPDGMQCSNITNLNESIAQLATVVQRAVTVELTTIPAYCQAWLSLQTEYGKNLEIAEVLRSVFVEEMYHMSLASNILNSVGGSVELTTFANVPIYPSPLGFGSFFQLSPDIMVTLEPMSLGLVDDIFSAIEQPAPEGQRVIFSIIACIWNLLSDDPSLIETPLVARFVNEFLDYKSKTFVEECVPIEIEDQWEKINAIASKGLVIMSETDITSIGALYTVVTLQLAFVESCAQMGSFPELPDNTLFVKNGDQIIYENYVFPVANLSTAVAAVIEIVYQGEGGSMCSPYVFPEGKELSHYYRFQEIVKGRRLVEVTDDRDIDPSSCLKLAAICAFIDQSKARSRFCYVGDPIPFNIDGVWPMVSNPVGENYEDDWNANKLNMRFNDAYTDLLKCLQDLFNGSPESLRACISKMYYMTVVGKILVKTPVEEGEYAKLNVNVSPTWSYVRNETDRAGLGVFTR